MRPHICPFCDQPFNFTHVGRCKDAVVYVLDEVKAQMEEVLTRFTDSEIVDKSIKTMVELVRMRGLTMTPAQIEAQRREATAGVVRLRRNFRIAGPKST